MQSAYMHDVTYLLAIPAPKQQHTAVHLAARRYAVSSTVCNTASGTQGCGYAPNGHSRLSAATTCLAPCSQQHPARCQPRPASDNFSLWLQMMLEPGMASDMPTATSSPAQPLEAGGMMEDLVGPLEATRPGRPVQSADKLSDSPTVNCYNSRGALVACDSGKCVGCAWPPGVLASKSLYRYASGLHVCAASKQPSTDLINVACNALVYARIHWNLTLNMKPSPTTRDLQFNSVSCQ